MNFNTIAVLSISGILGAALPAPAVAAPQERLQKTTPADSWNALRDAVDTGLFSYVAQSDEMSEAEIDGLAETLLDAGRVQLRLVTGPATDTSRFYQGMSDPSATLEIDPQARAAYFSKGYAQFLGEQSTPNLPRSLEAPRFAMKLLEDLQLVPQNRDELVVEHVGGVDMGVRREDGSTETFKKQVTVRYGRVLDGLPVRGSGSRIVVRMGAEGELAGVIYNWQELERRPIPAAQRLSGPEMMALVRARVLQIEADTVLTEIEAAELVLFDDGQGVLEPAIHVILQLTMEYTTTNANGVQVQETMQNPYDFFLPLVRHPRAQFPMLQKPAPRPQEAP